jgi:hypothetical protein
MPRRLPTLYALARAELMTMWTVDAGHIEGLARDAHEASRLTDPFDSQSGEAIAMALGYLVLRSPASACGVACLLPGILAARPSSCGQIWNLRVLHEIAHAILRAHHPHHSHADVWALTLALAAPRGTLRRLDAARHVPPWALRLRRQTARAVPQAA